MHLFYYFCTRKNNPLMETFNDVINSGQLVLADFFATWCGPCKAMHPVLEQLKAQLGDRIIKVDVDKHGIPAEEYTEPTPFSGQSISLIARMEVTNRLIDVQAQDYTC